jgi:hypothetical protein
MFQVNLEKQCCCVQKHLGYHISFFTFCSFCFQRFKLHFWIYKFLNNLSYEKKQKLFSANHFSVVLAENSQVNVENNFVNFTDGNKHNIFIFFVLSFLELF